MLLIGICITLAIFSHLAADDPPDRWRLVVGGYLAVLCAALYVSGRLLRYVSIRVSERTR